MTAKRFMIICDDNIEFIMQTQLLLPIYDNKERLSLKTCCDLLNELHDECEFLKIDNEALEHGATKYAELCHKSLKEIEQLKTDNGAFIQDIEVFKEENTHLKLENEQLKQRLHNVLEELYCKDRRLEELEEDIECCDRK